MCCPEAYLLSSHNPIFCLCYYLLFFVLHLSTTWWMYLYDVISGWSFRGHKRTGLCPEVPTVLSSAQDKQQKGEREAICGCCYILPFFHGAPGCIQASSIPVLSLRRKLDWEIMTGSNPPSEFHGCVGIWTGISPLLFYMLPYLWCNLFIINKYTAVPCVPWVPCSGWFLQSENSGTIRNATKLNHMKATRVTARNCQHHPLKCPTRMCRAAWTNEKVFSWCQKGITFWARQASLWRTQGWCSTSFLCLSFNAINCFLFSRPGCGILNKPLN